MCLGPVSWMDIHRDWVELFQASHGVEKHHNQTTALHGLNGPAKDIRGYALEVLQNAHSKGLTQDPMAVLVVAVPDIFWCQKQLNLIDLLLVKVAFGLLLLDLLQPLLFMTGELQLLLVAP